MDLTDKSAMLAAWLTAAESGEITFDEVKTRLVGLGVSELEAVEIVGIAQGETDVVQETL